MDICGILVLRVEQHPHKWAVSGCFDAEQQHESREVRECVGESVIRVCGYPIGTRVS